MYQNTNLKCSHETHKAFQETLRAMRVCNRLGFHSDLTENRTKCPQMTLSLGIQLSKGKENKDETPKNGRLICVLICVEGKQGTKSVRRERHQRLRAVGPDDGAGWCVYPPCCLI